MVPQCRYRESYYGLINMRLGADRQILFAVLSTRFITTIRLGWGWVILILVACASYYTLSIRRTRERARDDMQRELTKTRLVTETESADWMNSFLERFWLMSVIHLPRDMVPS